MKRICAGMTVLCLTASGLLASRPINDPPYFEEWPEETVVRFREEVKDLAKLKEHLERVTAPNLSGRGAMWWLYDQDMEKTFRVEYWIFQ